MNYTWKALSPFRRTGKVPQRPSHPGASLSTPSVQADVHLCITLPLVPGRMAATRRATFTHRTDQMRVKCTLALSPLLSIMAPSILLTVGKTSPVSSLHTNLRLINSQQSPAPSAAAPPPEFFVFLCSHVACQRLLDFHGRKKKMTS